MGVVAVGMAAGVTAFDFYPRVSTLELTPAALAMYIAFGALSLLPFTIEVEEAIVWRYYRSRMRASGIRARAERGRRGQLFRAEQGIPCGMRGSPAVVRQRFCACSSRSLHRRVN